MIPRTRDTPNICLCLEVLVWCRVAQRHADDMATRNYLGNIDLEGNDTRARFAEVGLTVGDVMPIYGGKSWKSAIIFNSYTLVLRFKRGMHKCHGCCELSGYKSGKHEGVPTFRYMYMVNVET
jgi:hypothetical protein